MKTTNENNKVLAEMALDLLKRCEGAKRKNRFVADQQIAYCLKAILHNIKQDTSEK